MWMVGYACRVHPSEGTLHDLRANALALEDASVKQAVFVITASLCSVSNTTDLLKKHLKLTIKRLFCRQARQKTNPKSNLLYGYV